jgi:hypothetical protein
VYPRMALSGVRSSWLIAARKSVLERFAASACARAASDARCSRALSTASAARRASSAASCRSASP